MFGESRECIILPLAYIDREGKFSQSPIKGDSAAAPVTGHSNSVILSTNIRETCSATSELTDNPFFWVGLGLAVFFIATLATILLCVFKRYKHVQVQYSRLLGNQGEYKDSAAMEVYGKYRLHKLVRKGTF